MFIQYLRSDRRIVGERLIPSFITNIPRGQQRAHIMALLYPWMCGFPDERDPSVRECYSFLRTAWYLPKGLPYNAQPGVQVRAPGLGLVTLTEEVTYDLTHFICWIRVRNVWIDALKGPVRHGAIGVPMTWSQLPEDKRPARSWISLFRTRLHHHFPSRIRPSIVLPPLPLHLEQEGSNVGPSTISVFNEDPYYAPMVILEAECEAEVEEFTIEVPVGVFLGGRYLLREV